ncbi:MAG: type II secretion system F family protein [Pseudomonadota bacterium]
MVWVLVDVLTHGLARYRAMFTERTTVRLRELFLFVDASRLFALNAALTLLAFAGGWWFGGPVMGAALALAAAVSPWITTRVLRYRRVMTIEQQLPDALLMLSGGLKAGGSLSAAIQQYAREARPPLSQEMDLVLREQRLGVPLDDALEGLGKRVPLQSMTVAISAMRIATETGGGLAEALERASTTLRSKLAMEGKIRALTAQGKLQALIVGLLPAAMLYAMLKLEPADTALLFTTRMGWGVLVVIGVLEFFGVLLIRKIVDIDV